MPSAKSSSGRMPVLFIGHGSPMNIIQDNSYTRSLSALAATLPRPSSILVVSAHWLTQGTWVTDAAKPRQIYDFYGFPDELYAVRYEPAGAPDEARRLISTALTVELFHIMRDHEAYDRKRFVWNLSHLPRVPWGEDGKEFYEGG